MQVSAKSSFLGSLSALEQIYLTYVSRLGVSFRGRIRMCLISSTLFPILLGFHARIAVKEWTLRSKTLCHQSTCAIVCPSNVTVVWERENITLICGCSHCVNPTFLHVV